MTAQSTHPANTNAAREWWLETYEHNWTEWANGNSNGTVQGPVFTPHPATALKGVEQSGYGLINLALGFKYPNGEQGWTDWVSGNSSGRERGPVYIPENDQASGIDVFEQAGFGLVDARLFSNSGTSDWLVNNHKQWLEELRVPSGYFVNGFEVREQSGYGIINLRLHYEAAS